MQRLGVFPQGSECELAERRGRGHHRCGVDRRHGQRGLELPASLLSGVHTQKRGEGDLQGGPQEPESGAGGGLG